jgi:hypothetical protein
LTGALVAAFGTQGPPSYWSLAANSWGAGIAAGILALVILGIGRLFPMPSSFAKRRWRTQLRGVLTWIVISILGLVVLAEIALNNFGL